MLDVMVTSDVGCHGNKWCWMSW